MHIDRIPLKGDWHNNGIPANIRMHDSVYIDSSYGFTAFHSRKKTAMTIGKGSGLYDKACIVTGEQGEVTVGAFSMINGSTIICIDRISIGDYCMLSWGVVVTDSWDLVKSISLDNRKQALMDACLDPRGGMPQTGKAAPVIIEDNVWVGFDSVIMPGVTLGRGCIAGSKTIIDRNVPPYTVMVGNPCRLVRYLDPTDNETYRARIMNEMGLQ